MESIYVIEEKWWSLLLRGLIATAVGVILLLWPGSTVKVLAYVVGILAILDGTIETVWALTLAFRQERMGMVLARGLVTLLIGILLLVKTGFVLTIVIVLLALWAIISGLVQIVAALELPPVSGRGLLAVAGAISIILGIWLLALPLETVYAIVVVFSMFLLITGLTRVIFSFYVMKAQKAG